MKIIDLRFCNLCLVCDFERENRRSEIYVCDFCVYVCDCVWILFVFVIWG